MSLLINVGNTCYLNSVLQIILNNTELITRLREHTYVDGLIPELLKLADKSLVPINTINFVMVLQKRAKFPIRNQNDAHEILLLLIEIFKEESLVFREFFNGQYNTNYTCCSCGNTRSVTEDFISIPLFPRETMKESLEDYIKTEYLDKIMCDNCEIPVKTRKKIKIRVFPRVLIFQIIRFISENKIKHNQHLVFRNTRYLFQGIINHSGSLESGHYTYTDSHLVLDDSKLYKMRTMTPKDHYLFIYSN